ncbi:MAG: T9SS type A sorting domain-containing protein [Bacteroidia bacterium]|nr:T9SS type A sorting domain-containing protein [Bacteroidia bacterium]
MRNIFIVIFSLIAFTSYSQVINGSFENGSQPDSTGWEWTCGAQIQPNAPTGGGNYCLQVASGNFQGCFPGYAYQRLPGVVNGQNYQLTGWAHTQNQIPVGIYFGNLKNGVFTLLAGDTTTSTTWTYLNVQSTFNLVAGDTAVIILHAGQTSGPAAGYGYFDLINLEPITGTEIMQQDPTIKIYPNPFSYQAVLQSLTGFQDATIQVVNAIGQVIRKETHISGEKFLLKRENLEEGIYFIQVSQGSKHILQAQMKILD